MAKVLYWGGHGLAVLLLTLLTFVGGIAWAAALFGTHIHFLFRFTLAYLALSLALLWLPHLLFQNNVVSVPRISNSVQSSQFLKTPAVYRLMNRDFVTPELHSVARDLADHMARHFPATPRTVTYALDGNFPFFDWLPLLPHLSHNDGKALDLALYWQDSNGAYVAGPGKSPLGYWGYVDSPSDCPPRAFDLRWDLNWLQPRLPDLQLDVARTREALIWLSQDRRVHKTLIEPHILAQIGYDHPKIRFQGCAAARHDDHIHIQL
ncbi:hypothetical protein TL5118_02158 [Thalassovita autumnalis]|uniref:Penicillin-insensitive murein endopeptidase n=1 Tax=Thalassovita autumnalis TaxID=2072972 RepID=A0A0P1FY59_9RHOB|nr:hypothetical protein [Thalassovita autumnalis]CUH67359.1 hypothetical protein TL5118_02158 [Thalassovita autumnalis]CUH73856.1 hypothetical protein TL5120_03673 [Thalassovita autumnalis]